MRPLPVEFYDRPTEIVARELIGHTLVRDTSDGPMGGVIVETEAYGPDDPANHAFRGKTARNAVMYGPPGTAYIYRIYGVHWCLNAVTGPGGVGEAVLIRAIRPTIGMDLMRHNRGIEDETRLARGPGLVCAALGISGDLNGVRLAGPALLIDERRDEGHEIVETTRIGITKAADRPWRFLVAGSPYVSGPRKILSAGDR